LKDFEGKSLAFAIGGNYKDFLRVAMENSKADFSKVKIQDVAAALTLKLFLDGKVDISTGTYVDYGFLENQVGPGKTRFLKLSDHGLNIYGYLLYTRAAVLQDDPDMVQAFVAATLKGMRETIQNPDEAATILVKANPNLDLAVSKVQVARWAELNKEAKELGKI